MAFQRKSIIADSVLIRGMILHYRQFSTCFYDAFHTITNSGGVEKMYMIITAIQKYSIVSLMVLLFAFPLVKAQEKDISLMTFDEYAKVSHGYPYIVELQIGKGSLLYFGARHIYDPKNPQMAQIEKLWKEFRPTVAYHESSGTSLSKTADEAVSKSGESGLVRFSPHVIKFRRLVLSRTGMMKWR